jgi:hypothetical protein
MTPPPGSEERRRSQRIALWVPLVGASLDPLVEFSGRLETVEVSQHGCLLIANRPFPHGTRLLLDIPYSKRSATAHIVRSDPLGPHGQQWYIALALDKAGDVWNVPWRAPDWGVTG